MRSSFGLGLVHSTRRFRFVSFSFNLLLFVSSIQKEERKRESAQKGDDGDCAVFCLRPCDWMGVRPSSSWFSFPLWNNQQRTRRRRRKKERRRRRISACRVVSYCCHRHRCCVALLFQGDTASTPATLEIAVHDGGCVAVNRSPAPATSVCQREKERECDCVSVSVCM